MVFEREREKTMYELFQCIKQCIIPRYENFRKICAGLNGFSSNNPNNLPVYPKFI